MKIIEFTAIFKTMNNLWKIDKKSLLYNGPPLEK